MPDRDNARVRIIRASNQNKESLKYYTYRQNTKCVPDFCRDAGVLLPAKMISSSPCGREGGKVHKERAYLVYPRIDRVLRYCRHIVMVRPAMAGQHECPKLASVPDILCLCRLVPETAE
jgi:hypothetical protein